MRFNLWLPSLAMLAALVALAAPAQAATVELLCTDPPDAPMHVSIDLVSRTATVYTGGGHFPTTPVQITDRFFHLENNNVTIDRMSGIVTWATGATGNCTPLKQRF